MTNLNFSDRTNIPSFQKHRNRCFLCTFTSNPGGLAAASEGGFQLRNLMAVGQRGVPPPDPAGEGLGTWRGGPLADSSQTLWDLSRLPGSDPIPAVHDPAPCPPGQAPPKACAGRVA